jgi:hypothetical protein
MRLREPTCVEEDVVRIEEVHRGTRSEPCAARSPRCVSAPRAPSLQRLPLVLRVHHEVGGNRQAGEIEIEWPLGKRPRRALDDRDQVHVAPDAPGAGRVRAEESEARELGMRLR